MTTLLLIFAILISPQANAAEPATSGAPTPLASPVTSSAASPAASAAPTPATATVKVIQLPPGPTTGNKEFEFSVRAAVTACTQQNKDDCVIDTFIVANAPLTTEPAWERRIFFQRYDVEKPIEGQVISIKSMKLVKKTMLSVTNSRGDSFELETGHGNMKRPTSPREYRK